MTPAGLPSPLDLAPVDDGSGTWEEAWWKAVPEGAWVACPARQDLVRTNTALEALWGRPLPAGLPWADFVASIHPDDRPRLDQRPLSPQEVRVVRPDGTLRWVRWQAFALPSPRGVVQAGLVTDVHARHEQEEQLRRRAHRDDLTGLPNRWALAQALDARVAQAHAQGTPLAVLLLDLDGFKQVNDSLGHADGDRALQRVASRLAMIFEGSPDHLLGRLGGDEFAMVLTGSAAHDPMAVAAVVLDHLRRPIRWHDQAWSVGASIGAAQFPAHGTTTTNLLRCADTALFEAKAEGKHLCRLYHPDMAGRVRGKRELAGALRQALVNQEFELHYQPKVHLATGHWTGVEALLRWNRPGVGAVLPSFFIEALEETNLILPLGQWVIQEACRQMQIWKEQGLPPVRVAVNVSARQMGPSEGMGPVACNQDFENMVESTLRTYPEAHLDLELTETTLMAHSSRSVGVLARLRDQGVRWSLDDFGTGYSSLAYLKRFPLNTLKIDRMFVRDLSRNTDDAAIVGAIIGMAHSLRLNVVAEGVETAEQQAVLQSLGCDEIQGYVVTPPLDGPAISHWLRTTPAYQAKAA